MVRSYKVTKQLQASNTFSFILFLYLAVAQYAMSRIWVDDDDGKESLFKVTCLLVFQWVSPKVGLTMAKGLTVAKCGTNGVKSGTNCGKEQD